MRMRHAIVLLGLIWPVSAQAQDFRIEDVASARGITAARLKPGVIEFSDKTGTGAVDSETALIHFEEWTEKHANEKKFLALFPGYIEPTIARTVEGNSTQAVEKLYMYIAQARFSLSRAPGAIDLSHYVTLPFLEKIDPAIKHKEIAAADIVSFKDEVGSGNDNPDRKWCAVRPASICIQSTYAFEGRIPLGIALVNKLRDSKKVADHIEFQSELSAPSPADLDQAGLQELTALDAPIAGVLEQNIFYVNQIMKFGKLLAVFQTDPADAGKTVVTAFMALAIKARVLDERRQLENVPVLRNLVPAQVLMGQSSFNAGDSISGGLPKYARNEIKTIAGILATTK